jgi:hypothetical protein
MSNGGNRANLLHYIEHTLKTVAILIALAYVYGINVNSIGILHPAPA